MHNALIIRVSVIYSQCFPMWHVLLEKEVSNLVDLADILDSHLLTANFDESRFITFPKKVEIIKNGNKREIWCTNDVREFSLPTGSKEELLSLLEESRKREYSYYDDYPRQNKRTYNKICLRRNEKLWKQHT